MIKLSELRRNFNNIFDNRYLTVKNTSIKIDNNKYNNEIKFIDIKPDKLYDVVVRSNEVIDNLNSNISKNVTNPELTQTNNKVELTNELIQHISSLFYSDSSTTLPRIYQLIEDIRSNDTIPDKTGRLEALKKLCEQSIFHIEPAPIKLSCNSTFWFSKNNFKDQLLDYIQNAKEYIESEINIQEKLQKNDVNELTNLVKDTLLNINNLMNDHKFGINKNNCRTTQSSLMLSNICAVTLNSTSATSKIANKTSANITSFIGPALAGAAYATSQAATINKSSLYYQKLGVQKKQLLYLYHELAKRGYRFTQPQRQTLKKFLEIKRGNIFDKLFCLTTESYDTFKELKNKDINGITELKILSVPIDTYNDISTAITMLLKKKEYSRLIGYLETLSDKDKATLPDIIFEIGKFRGSLLSYLLIQGDDKSNQDLQELQTFITNLYSGEYLSNIQIYGLNKEASITISTLQEKPYDELAKLLRTYDPVSKHQTILDITHLIFCIRTHPSLVYKERMDLITYMREQIEKKENGYFRSLMQKRGLTENIIISTVVYSIANMASYFTMNLIPSIITAYINNGNYGIVDTLLDKSSIKRTTSFRMVKKLLYSEPTWLLKSKDSNTADLVKPEYNNPPKTVTATITELKENFQNSINNYTNIKQDLNNLNTIDITSNIALGNNCFSEQLKKEELRLNRLKEHELKHNKTQNIAQINKILNECTNTLESVENNESEYNKQINLAYFALTDIKDHNFLLSQLLSTYSEHKETTILINTLWQKIIKHKYKHSITNIHDFNQFIANYSNLENSTSTLLAFFEINTLINTFVNSADSLEIKLGNSMLDRFTKIIIHTPHFPDSPWYNLLKRKDSVAKIIKTGLEASGCSMQGGVGALMSTGIGIPIALAILFANGIISGAVIGSADSFEHATILKTNEYKTAVNFLEQYEDVIKYNKNLLDEFKEFYQCTHNEDFQTIKSLIVENGQLTQFLETYFSPPDKSKPIGDSSQPQVVYKPDEEDHKYVDQLKGAQSTSEQVIITGRIIAEIKKETINGYKPDENQALFRIVNIISAGIKDKIQRFEILIGYLAAYINRDLDLSKNLSQERAYLARKNYFITDILYGILTSLANLTLLPIAHVSGIAQSAAYSGADISEFILDAFKDNIDYDHDTTSFQNGLDFLKDVTYDLILSIRQDQYIINDLAYNHFIELHIQFRELLGVSEKTTDAHGFFANRYRKV